METCYKDMGSHRVPSKQEHLPWLADCFKKLVAYRKDATFGEGFIYATLCLYRDIEPGLGEGIFNPYEALLANNQEAERRILAMPPTSYRRAVGEFRSGRRNHKATLSSVSGSSDVG